MAKITHPGITFGGPDWGLAGFCAFIGFLAGVLVGTLWGAGIRGDVGPDRVIMLRGEKVSEGELNAALQHCLDHPGSCTVDLPRGELILRDGTRVSKGNIIEGVQ